MIKKLMEKKIIIIIFLFALFLRVYKLGQYPSGFLWDEAALGYNAYSVLKTGKDEYGKFLPFIFKSFGDYKPGFYIYLTVPSIAVFGLNEFAVRFPSAFFGSLSVVILYFLIQEAGKASGQKKDFERIAIVSALLLAINPWHLNFSRGAWELNVMTFEILAALWLAVKFLNTQKRFLLYLSCIFFVLTFITYQSAKLLTPVLLFSFAFFYREKIKKIGRKPKIIFLSIFFLVFLFFNLMTFWGKMSGRLKVMSLFSYPRSEQETKIIQDQDNHSNFLWYTFHSSPIFFARSFLGRFFNHFSGKFLFFDGDWSNPRNGVVNHGLFYFIDIIFLIWGMFVLLGKKRSSLENLMLFWLVFAPVPSATTRDIISSVRSFTLVIPLVFITATGVIDFINFFQKRKLFIRYVLSIIFVLSYLFLFVRFLDYYFVHNPILNSKDRLYGYKEAIEVLNLESQGKDKIVMTTKYGQPHIFYLFYTQYDPSLYQKQARLVENPWGDVGRVEKIDNIEFREIYWPTDRGIKTLFLSETSLTCLFKILSVRKIFTF